jgi:hypothetical protein
MPKYDAKTRDIVQQWVERDARATIGVAASPGCTVQDIGDYQPKGRNAWFGYAISEVGTLFTLRRMSESWRFRPPLPDLRYYTPMIRKYSDDLTTTAQLPPHTTLAQWYRANEWLLQQDPSSRARSLIVAAALLPLFENEPESWEAIKWLDDDFSHGSFSQYLGNWYARVPTKLRPFVQRIAREFGVNISGDENPQGLRESQDSM